MKSKRSATATKLKPRGFAGEIPIFCAYDAIVPASDLKLWNEQPKSKNPQVHTPTQLDRYETVIKGNGFRRAAVRSSLSGCITKGNGMVMMARRLGWPVPIEDQQYSSRAEEIRDVAADNELSKLARTDKDALQQLLGELDPGEVQFAAVSEEEFARLVAESNVPDAEFPITAKLGESYDYALIYTTNATEFAFLQNLLGLQLEKSYKKTGVGLGRAVSLDRALAALRANRHSLDVQGGNDDHAQAAAERGRVDPAKPARRISKGRRA